MKWVWSFFIGVVVVVVVLGLPNGLYRLWKGWGDMGWTDMATRAYLFWIPAALFGGLVYAIHKGVTGASSRDTGN